ARLRRFSYDATSAFVGNSKAVIDSLVQREGVPQERCRVIYQAVETPTVDPADGDAFRTEYDIPPDVTVIGLLANLHPIKNHSMLIRAVAMLCSDYPDVWSVFAGNTDQDQAYTQHLRAEIATHGLADRVVLTGRLSDTRGFLAAIDIGVLCSHAEGFSNALLEYMAYGKVPVATAVGGNPEAITHRETGFLIPPNDDKALAETLAVLLSDDRQRAQIGQQARQYVEKTFTAAREYEQWATLLEVHNG
ncbi:MAG: glycosyltransferase, partial [Anaerolineae bacterium]